MQSISLVEKPVEHVPEADWIGNVWNLRAAAETKRKVNFDVKNENRQFRNDAGITSMWTNYHSNKRLADRITSQRRALEDLKGATRNLDQNLERLTQAKMDLEGCMEKLNLCMQVLAQVVYVRDQKFRTNLVDDKLYNELSKEVVLVETNKTFLANKCFAAWEQMTRAAEMLSKLRIDIESKTDSLDIDSAVISLDKNNAGNTFKPDVLRIPECSLTFEAWLDGQMLTMLNADNEASTTRKLYESMMIVKDKLEQDFLASYESVNYEFRKKIFETERQKKELEYQREKVVGIMEGNLREVELMRHCHADTILGLKCAETRVESRNTRPCSELTRDEAQLGLMDEVKTLRDLEKELKRVTDNCLSTESDIESFVTMLDVQLGHKKSALEFEKKAFDLHKTLYKVMPLSQIDRNIKLFNMDKDLPPEIPVEIIPD